MSTVIKVENLFKRYYLSHKSRESFHTLRDSITRTASNLGNRLLHPLKASSGQPLEGLDSTEEFWALNDVSFEIKQGDRVGIIGRNGAGKSTLLKVLSRITEPTRGRVSIKGRVASLLEVGTGFHPELTGRENIFLNGAILGMSRTEIKSKFDEIVAFAEIEKFLDTPVKRYSSGMYVRLAFAVAAHLEPEILIIDEVLAVGDLKFQKKCLGKMEEVSAGEGRTVLFVSHNMSAIQSLCNVGILMDYGFVRQTGLTSKVVCGYTDLLATPSKNTSNKIMGSCVKNISIKKSEGVMLTPDDPLNLDVIVSTSIILDNCYLNLVVEDCESNTVLHFRTDNIGVFPTLPPGEHQIRINIPRLSIRSGVYTVWFRLYSSNSDVCEIIDSERIILEVDGAQVSGMVDVPCKWFLNDQGL